MHNKLIRFEAQLKYCVSQWSPSLAQVRSCEDQSSLSVAQLRPCVSQWSPHEGPISSSSDMPCAAQ